MIRDGGPPSKEHRLRFSSPWRRTIVPVLFVIARQIKNSPPPLTLLPSFMRPSLSQPLVFLLVLRAASWYLLRFERVCLRQTWVHQFRITHHLNTAPRLNTDSASSVVARSSPVPPRGGNRRGREAAVTPDLGCRLPKRRSKHVPKFSEPDRRSGNTGIVFLNRSTVRRIYLHWGEICFRNGRQLLRRAGNRQGLRLMHYGTYLSSLGHQIKYTYGELCHSTNY